MATVVEMKREQREGLRWLQGRLAWEQTLAGLRNPTAARPDDRVDHDERPAA